MCVGGGGGMGVIGSGDGDYIGKRVKNNITYVSMTTKYPIIEHRVFSKL